MFIAQRHGQGAPRKKARCLTRKDGASDSSNRQRTTQEYFKNENTLHVSSYQVLVYANSVILIG